MREYDAIIRTCAPASEVEEPSDVEELDIGGTAPATPASQAICMSWSADGRVLGLRCSIAWMQSLASGEIMSHSSRGNVRLDLEIESKSSATLEPLKGR